MNHDVLSKILIVGSCLGLCGSMLVIIGTPPVSGYELSIYQAFPLYFWVFLLMCICGGIIVFFLEIFSRHHRSFWIYGLVLIIMGNCIVLLLPLFRGYSFTGGADADIFSHVGFIKEIVLTGHFSANNFYPVVHVLAYSSSGLLGLQVNTTLFYLPPVFTSIYMLGMFLLAQTIVKDKKQALLITVLSGVLIYGGFHASILPSFFSFVLLPVLIYLYVKRLEVDAKIESTIMLIVFCFFIVFFHPMTTVFAIIIFFLTFFSNSLISYLRDWFKIPVSHIYHHNENNMILLLSISFIAWYTSFREGRSDMIGIIRLLFFRPEWEVSKEYISPLLQANLSVVQFVELVLLRYGSIVVFGFIGAVGMLYVLKKLIVHRELDRLEFFYAVQVVCLFFLGVIMLSGYFYNFNPVRVFRFFLMMVTIFNGIMLFAMSTNRIKTNVKQLRRYLFPVVVTGLICLCCIGSIFNVFASPIIWQPNRQFTHENYLGSEWMVEYRQRGIQISHDIGTDIRRMDHLLNGLDEENLFLETRLFEIPSHFGYDQEPLLVEVFDMNTTYMVHTENAQSAVQAFPGSIQEKVDQFTVFDYQRLRTDKSVVKIYEDGGVSCYLVES